MNNPNQNDKTANTQKDVPAQQQRGQSSPSDSKNTQKDAPAQQQQGQSSPSDSKNTQQGGTEDKSRTDVKKGTDAGAHADHSTKTAK